jgi:hypothetical protein
MKAPQATSIPEKDMKKFTVYRDSLMTKLTAIKDF